MEKRGTSRLRPAWGATLGVDGGQHKSHAFDGEFVAERRPHGEIAPLPGKLRDGCLKCLIWGLRDDPGTSGPNRFRVGARITANEHTMAVVDPNPDRSK